MYLYDTGIAHRVNVQTAQKNDVKASSTKKFEMWLTKSKKVADIC